MREDDLTVGEAADALGTSPQTIRALLRKGDLQGQKRAWGTRYVWVPSRQGINDFLSEHGRIDGHRRRRQEDHQQLEQVSETVTIDSPKSAPTLSIPSPREETFEPIPEPEPSASKPFVLRPRGRATAVVVALGVPLFGAYAAARIIPDALWFGELGQSAVFDRVLAARVELYVLVAGTVALFVEANLAIACRQSDTVRTRTAALAPLAVSLVTASLFAVSANAHWQTYLLWRHRQTFGIVDPIHGTDVGYFVFALPFQLTASGWLLALGAVTTCFVAIVYRARGDLSVRPPRATFGCQVHLASLAAIFLLVVAWRLRLEQYLLELRQPALGDSRSFSGAGYVDVHVRLPGLVVLTILAVVLAFACVVAPFVARTASARRAVLFIGIPGGLLVVGVALVAALIPALVQRYLVDPNPLLSERPFLERSIAATRSALGLDTVYVEGYSPTGGFQATDYSQVSERLGNVQIWDEWILQARMRDLVTETPYYSPQEPMLDVVQVDGRPRLTVVSARELDLRLVRGAAKTWSNDRLAYTHGLGLIRFSGTETEQNREPRLVDAGLGVREPRIYFGNPPQLRGRPADEEEESQNPARTTSTLSSASPWVLVDTRRPEVDIPVSEGTPRAPYHHEGGGGIKLSTWLHRAAFALELGSKELLLSDDITSESRILLHRDVSDRLQTLAPFIHWDADGVPLTANGRVVFVVDGYTTSDTYPYAERVDLGGARVNYARASVRATVDAFSGRVDVYLTDESEPLARAWAETFPTLFRPESDMPGELRKRLRYPPELFNAQASAYERFHTTRPDLFVSDADVWSRPTALAGPLEVAGDVNFDESDEDELRLPMKPGYTVSAPPGQTTPRVVLGTFYTPRRGQNLVATLSGWIDDHGRARLAARSLPRAPVTLGPAQVSRLVFATPRVSRLLGLRNLEVRDLDKSSLDQVLLGEPHLLFLPRGVIQIQSLFEGSRGPGAARLLGVTAFLNGRAGLGPDIESAVRQALNQPPQVDVLHPAGPMVVGKPVELAFRVANASREVVTITSSGRSTKRRLTVANGVGTVTLVPSAAGVVRMQVVVTGLDGTLLKERAEFRVLSAAPTIRLLEPPSRAVSGRPVRVSFKVTNAVDELAKVSTPAGIVFSRRYLIRDGKGVVNWTPGTSGTAELIIRVRGHQGQVATRTLRLAVAERPEAAAPPTVTLVRVPDTARVGRAARFAFRADRCTEAVARIEGPGDDVHLWRFACPAHDATFTWTPTRPGNYVLTTSARGESGTAQVATPLRVERSR